MTDRVVTYLFHDHSLVIVMAVDTQAYYCANF